MIKSGHPKVLTLFGFEECEKIRVEKFKIEKLNVTLGENLPFSFNVISEKTNPQKLVIDFKIHYRKKSGTLSPKVFKLKELVLQPKQTVPICKLLVFRDFSTRKHYSGSHFIEIMINGNSYIKKEFSVKI